MRIRKSKESRGPGIDGGRGLWVGCALALPSAFTALPAVAQNSENVGTLEEIIVTARFRSENLQDTPLAITAITGDELEARGLTNIEDLGLAIPNSNIRESGNMWGPTSAVGMRGVNTMEFIYTSEPGVGIYVDDVYHGTLTGSNIDLLDLERVEVLRGPQGTLFGKNSLGGAIRMISKAPQGDNQGYLDVTAGTSNRLDLKGSVDFALVEDTLFLRLSGASKQIDGFQDVLDFACYMRAVGTPALSGTLPSLNPGSQQNAGDCKINENGGSESNAGRAMLRWTPSERFELNWSADAAKTVDQNGAETLLKGGDPADFFHSLYVANVIRPRFGITYLDDRFVPQDRFTTFANHNDPVTGARWPTDVVTDSWSTSVKADWDISEKVHLKGIAAYRTYDSDWASDGDFTPFDTSTTLNNQFHEQTTFEVQLSGLALNDRLEWTGGIYSYDSTSHLGGFVTLPQLTPFIIPSNFAQDDGFTTESESVFIHGVFGLTDKLNLTAGVRYTDEAKTYTFSHYFVVPDPLNYGESNVDYKLSLDRELGENSMLYVMTSTGFRSSGANPRPFTVGQLQPFPGEELTAFEVGYKTDFLDNRLRFNTAVFLNDYDPRAAGVLGIQCNLVTDPNPGPRLPFAPTCPPGTPLGDLRDPFGNPSPTSAFWFDQITTSGKAKGAEFEITWSPTDKLAINGTLGYYEYEPDAAPGQPGFLHPTYLEQPEFSYSLGGQYSFALAGGGRVVPRLDMFYVGERTNTDPTAAAIKPYHFVPDYTLVNGRVSFISADGAWTMSLEANNLLDKFYWINLGAERMANGISTAYNRTGTPGRPREIALSLRRNFN
jgi:iron complex outermembrane recepter protein